MNIYLDTTRFIWEVLEKGEYSYLFDHLSVVDLGCNIGAFSFWIYPRADIINAVDLSPRNIDNLKKTIASNNLLRIRPHCCAITGTNGTRKASYGQFDGDGSGKLTDEGVAEVDGYTLASFMDRAHIEKIDVLKMDVEGAEYEILQASDFPRDKVSIIIGEYHGQSVGNILKNLGYSYQEFGSHFLAR